MTNQQNTAFESSLDIIMEDLIVGHNFNYARKFILAAYQADLDRVHIDTQKHYEAVCDEMAQEVQTNAVAWAVGVIDDLHATTAMGQPVDLDREYKGIKNTIRDRFKAEVGIDPVPKYPIHAQLTKEDKK